MAERGPLGELHPVIRIVSLVALASCVALGGGGDIALAAGLVALAYLFHHPVPWQSARRMLVRMRWFFISLLVLYFWFTPGEPVMAAIAPWTAWLPTWEGIQQGLIRVSALVVIVLAVNLMLSITSREELSAGLLWLAGPLKVLGVNRARLALRISLVLSAVPRVQELMGDARQEVKASGMRGVAALGAVVAGALERTLGEADHASLSPLTIEFGPAPPVWQWGLPTALVAVWWLAI